MAELRPFRGLRYTGAVGPLGPLLSTAPGILTPNQREDYAVRNPHNVVHIASPEGHADDRSKFIRYARASAHLAAWRRDGILAPEAKPAFYRLTQRFGHTPSGDPILHLSLLATARLNGLVDAEAADLKAREDRLRLLEATRTTFEPATAFYRDSNGKKLASILAAPASSEVSGNVDGLEALIETIDEADAIAAIEAAFGGDPILVADGVDGIAAARAFREDMGEREGAIPEDYGFVALSSLDDASTTRLPVHRVVRRFPGGLDPASLLTRLATRFAIEEHHNRNLIVLMDRAQETGHAVFGLATEGGRGYLLTPLEPVEGPAATWLHREIFGALLGFSPNESLLYLSDPIQAVRAADEGAAGAFLLPRPSREDIVSGEPLPYRSATSFPTIPVGMVMWAMGDNA